MNAWDALFADLSEHHAQAMLDACHDIAVEADEVVMTTGDEDPALIYVLEGEVAVVRGGVQLAVCGAGQIIGEMALFRQTPRMAEVVTRAPTRALVLTRAAYDALVVANNRAVFRLERLILTQLGERLRRMDGLVTVHADGEVDPYRKPPQGFLAQIRSALLGDPPPDVVPRDFDPVQVLERSHLFRGERYTLVAGLAGFLERGVWAPGEVLCEQGAAGDAIYLIAEGEADVFVHVAPGRIHKLGTVGRGACVGMSALVDGRPRMASVVATEQVDALVLPKVAFDALVARDGQIQSALRRAMIRAFADQVEEAGAHLVSLTRPDVPPEITAHVTTEIYTE